VVGIAAPWISPYDPQLMHAGQSLSGPSADHWLGADQLGRDTLSRLIHGARISLQISVYSVTLAFIGGVTVGVVSSYFGGWVETTLMRLVDVLLAFPALVLAIVVAAYLGASMFNVTLVIAVVYMPVIARLTYVVTMSVKNAEFVEAARVVGSSDMRIILRAILPNSLAPLIVQLALSLGAAIMTESGLSFLGVGVPPPAPSWGSQIASARLTLNLEPLQVVWPALVILIAILSFNILGDAIRDFLDPRIGR
jgi:peptide/nickel transport system permease protein